MVKLAGLALGVAVGVGLERLTLPRLMRGPDAPVAERERPRALHHSFPTADGGLIHVVESGPAEGPPVVLLHGVTLRASIWHRLDVLAPPLRLIALDLRGHGESIAGTDGPSIEAGAGDLAMVLAAMDLHGAVVVGHSMGGMVLGRFLVDHPETAAARIGAVGFLASAGRVPNRVPTGLLSVASRRLASVAAWNPGLVRSVTRVPVADIGAVSVRATFGRPARPEDVREVAEAFDSVDPADFLAIAPSLLTHDVLDDLAGVSIPAAVMAGRRDPITPPSDAKKLAAALPNSTLQIVPQAGHQLMLERPVEVAEMIVDLVTRAGHSVSVELPVDPEADSDEVE